MGQLNVLSAISLYVHCLHFSPACAGQQLLNCGCVGATVSLSYIFFFKETLYAGKPQGELWKCEKWLK